jgi:hypothetical protein
MFRARSQIVGWEWRKMRNRIEIVPTLKVYLRVLGMLILIPGLILGCLALALGTPWKFHQTMQGSTVVKPEKVAADPELVAMQERMKIELREQVGEEKFAEYEQKWAAEAQERQEKLEQQNRALSKWGWLFSIIYGMFWSLVVLYALALIIVLIRLPSSKYIFERDPSGKVIIQLPRLFSSQTYRFAQGQLVGVTHGANVRVYGKYGYRVVIWTLQLVDRVGKVQTLPHMEVFEEPYSGKIGRPPEEVVRLQTLLRNTLGVSVVS